MLCWFCEMISMKWNFSSVPIVDWSLWWFSVRPWSHAKTNYLSYRQANNYRNPWHYKWCECSHRCWLIGLESSLQRRSASDSSDNVGLVTLAAFHGHIDFSPTLQIIAGCCESYPPRPAGRSLCSVLTREWLSDLRNVISWHLIDCHWLLCSSCLWYEYI